MGLIRDAKFAVRMLSKSPVFTFVAVLSLALAIGPNTAVFSLVDRVMLSDWGVGAPETLLDVYGVSGSGSFNFTRYSTYETVRDGTADVFAGVTGYAFTAANVEQDGEPRPVLVELVTGNYFDVMQVTAARGRTFVPEEDVTEGTHPVVVVSDFFWRTRSDADPGLVGGVVRLNGRPFTVVGVAPPDFTGRVIHGMPTDLWVPFSMHESIAPGQMTGGNFTISARMLPGIPAARGVAAVEALAARIDAERDSNFRFRLAAMPLSEIRVHPSMDSVVTAMVAMLFAVVALVLLVACVNLAGFLLARATDRRKEIAVRLSMGAGRIAILRQLLVESLLLAAMGGALGALLGRFALRGLLAMEPPLPVPMNLEVGLNPRVLAFTAGTAALAALIFGLAPGLQSIRTPVASTLRDEGGHSGGRGKSGARALLVAAQMTLSTVLLVATGLFLRSLQAATQVDVGFSTAPAGIVTVGTWANQYDADQRTAFVERMLDDAAAQPGLTDVAVTSRLPLGLGMRNRGLDVPGVDPPPDADFHMLEVASVSPDYFATMDIPLLSGRAFGPEDAADAPQVVIVSEAAQRRFWPGEDAVGRIIHPAGEPDVDLTVVGVVDNVKIWNLVEPPHPYLYVPYAQSPSPTFSFVARGPVSDGELAASLGQQARALDPEVYLETVGTLDEHVSLNFFLPRMAALLLSGLASIALVLTCVGLYGLISYGVARRTREMGIRLALGAERGSLVTLVVRGGLVLVLIGGGLGIVAALGVGRLLRGFLIGVGPLDPVALVGAPLLLGAVAVVAAYLPARRTSRVNPVEALRSE